MGKNGCSSSNVGRFEDEGVVANNKTDSREGSRLDASIPVQNLAFWLELIAISLYFCK